MYIVGKRLNLLYTVNNIHHIVNSDTALGYIGSDDHLPKQKTNTD